MKQTSVKAWLTSPLWNIAKFIAVFLWVMPQFNYAMIECTDQTQSATIDDITVTVDYPQCACVGDEFTIVYTVESDVDIPFDFGIRDFTPGTCCGLTFVSSTPPNPAMPSSIFTPNASSCSAGDAVGRVTFPDSEFQPNLPYVFTITLEATVAGIQNWTPLIGSSSLNECAEELFDITILVNPRAIVPNDTGPTGCNNEIIPGTLPFTTGPTGPFVSGTNGPFYYSVDNPFGGTVILVNPNNGSFQFDADNDFVGNASFEYNVNPTGPGLPQFCPAATPGIFTIPIVDAPDAADVTITGCANTGITGSLVPFVTGGSGSYVFNLVTGPSCGSVTVGGNGNFLFTGPTGGNTCTFVYQATDTVAPFCHDTGVVSVTVSPGPTANNQTLQTCTDQPVSGTLTGSGGNPPYTSFAIVPSSETNGTVTSFDSTTGEFTFTPALGFNGQASFQFTVTDSDGCVSAVPGTVTINVNPFPTTSSTSIMVCQNTQFNGTLVPLVTGGTGPLVFSQTGPAPTCGTIIINPSGPFTFFPNFGSTSSCSFQFFVTQGGCPGTGPHTVSVTISPAPTTRSSVTGVCAGGTVTDDLNNYVISAPGNLTFTAEPAIGGTLTLDPSGPFTFMTTIGSSGTGGFDWQVMSDLLSCPSAPQTYTIIINQPPRVITGQIGACGTGPTQGSLVPNVPGGPPPLSFTGPITVTGGTVTINPNGTFTFTADPGATGGNFTFEVTNGNGCTGAGTELVFVNPSPTATGGTGIACSATPTTGNLGGQVSGGTPPYFFAQVGPASGGTVTVNPNGNFTFTPSAGSTSGSFVFRVTDGQGCSATASFAFTVNQSPTGTTGMFTGCGNGTITGSLVPLVTGSNPPFSFTGPFNQVNGSATVVTNGDFTFTSSIAEGQASFGFVATDSGIPPCSTPIVPVIITVVEGPEALPAFFTGCQNTPFTASLVPFVSGGMPPYSFTGGRTGPGCGIAVVQPNGTFSFIPTPGFTGPCSFVWQVTDSTPCSDTGPATVNVGENPVASNAGPFLACTNNPFIGDLNAFVLGGIPPYIFTGGNEVNGSLALQASGPFAFTPSGPVAASFDYSATDTAGCSSNTAVVSFTVRESPLLVGANPLDTCEDTPVTSTVTATLGAPSYTFTIEATTNGTAMIDSVLGGTATFTFTPDPDLVFPTPTVLGSVTIRATDSNECFGEIIIIVNIHQNPVLTLTGIISCTGGFTGDLEPFVTGGIPPYIFEQTGPVSPSGCGTVVIAPSGDFVFTSPVGFSGPCTFGVAITESSTGACTSTGSVTVTVDIPPVAVDAIICGCPNIPFTSSLAGFVSGGVPPYTFSIVGGFCTPIAPQLVSCLVTGGTVILNTQTGQFTFSPSPGPGVREFDFQVTDSLGCVSNVATITLTCCPFTGLGPV